MRKHVYGVAYGYTLWLYRKAWYLLLGFGLITTVTVVAVVLYPKCNQQPELEFGSPEFLVNSEQCKIPNVLPWNSEFKKFYVHKKPYKCSTKEMLTYIAYDGDRAFLCVNESAVGSYSRDGVDCCYQTIKRQTGDIADIEIKYSKCKRFQHRFPVKGTEVVVKCWSRGTQKNVYNNAHSIIFKSFPIKRKIAAFESLRNKPPSILLIGLDSVSRLNFHRMLPETKKYLDRTGWIEYKGYNKVGENTFPNLMALLTGRNLSRVFDLCHPSQTGSLDVCNYIWKNYSESNYVTLYMEDAVGINTFTYLKKGFLHPPTDLYYKPYLIAAENLGTTNVDGMNFCSGPVSSGERVLHTAKDFLIRISDQPKFGLFWSNTFSHDDINTPARMDRILANFFEDIHNHLNNTIVLFFSDHGMRFGNIRQTKTGWYEERLPYAYFWFPPNFIMKFPSEYNNIIGNSIKLTTPYDIYMTLHHLLELYDNKVRSHCDATPKCKSLLEDVGYRSCDDLNIPIHYCTCFGYKPYNTQSPLAKKAGEFAVNELNKIIKEDVNTSRCCALYNFDEMTLAQTAIYKNVTYLLFQLRTVPEAIFEFTVSVNTTQNDGTFFKRESGISRLDKYEPTSNCVSEKKMYCYCRSNAEMKMNFFSFWFEV